MRRSMIPQCIFGQVDSCTQKIMNRFVPVYPESFLAWRMVTKIVDSFLSTGHHHEDIDQALGCTLGHLQALHAVALLNLHPRVYNNETTICRLYRIANISDLCEGQGCWQNVRSSSPCRSFKFGGNHSCAHLSLFTMVYNIKKDVTPDWSLLHQDFDGYGTALDENTRRFIHFSHTWHVRFPSSL